MKRWLALAALGAALLLGGCRNGGEPAGSEYPYHGPLVDNGGQVVQPPNYGEVTNATPTGIH